MLQDNRPNDGRVFGSHTQGQCVLALWTTLIRARKTLTDWLMLQSRPDCEPEYWHTWTRECGKSWKARRVRAEVVLLTEKQVNGQREIGSNAKSDHKHQFRTHCGPAKCGRNTKEKLRPNDGRWWQMCEWRKFDQQLNKTCLPTWWWASQRAEEGWTTGLRGNRGRRRWWWKSKKMDLCGARQTNISWQEAKSRSRRRPMRRRCCSAHSPCTPVGGLEQKFKPNLN